MTIKQMQTFATVCREGSVTAAAEKLYVAQSAVSRTLRELSRQYGITLFEHVGGHLKPTDFALQLLEDINELLDLYQNLEDKLQSGGYSVSLHIGCSMAVGASILPRAITVFEQKNPTVSLQIEENNTAEIEARVLSGELDFGLIAGNIHDQKLVEDVFIEEKLCWACHVNSPILKEGKVTLARLARERLYLPSEDIGGREQLNQYAMAQGVELRPVWSTVNVTAQMDAILQDRGISLLSEKIIQPYTATGRLAVIPTDMQISRKMGAIYLRRKHLGPEARAFIELCRSVAWHL